MTNAFVKKLCRLSDLDETDVRALVASTSQSRSFPSRSDLIREGDRPGPVFVMLSGWACRYKILLSGSRQITSFMMPGDSCDLHVSLLAEMDHSIQTITEATVATIPQATMQDMLWKSPAISRALYSAQLIDEGTLRAWIVSMGRRSSIERVAHLMCELYIRMQNIDEETSSRVDVPVSQILFADALGMTPVHINRVLRRLREANVMNISRRSIRITDPIRLANLAGFDDNYLHRRLRTDD